MRCVCCTKHVPKPVLFLEYNGVPLCPTSYHNAVELEFELTSGAGPEVTKHYSKYIRDLVTDVIYNRDNE